MKCRMEMIPRFLIDRPCIMNFMYMSRNGQDLSKVLDMSLLNELKNETVQTWRHLAEKYLLLRLIALSEELFNDV
jgi:hypothetical protein